MDRELCGNRNRNPEDDLAPRDWPKCAECGCDDHRVLRITKKDDSERGIQQPLQATDSLGHTMFAFEAAGNPDAFFLRCENCWDRFTRSTGRPPKYTPEERAVRKAEAVRKYKETVNQRAIDLYGGRCVECDLPATRLVYIGPPGQGPKPGEFVRIRVRLLDPKWQHLFINEYQPYCMQHGDTSFLYRVEQAKTFETDRKRAIQEEEDKAFEEMLQNY